MREHEFTIDLPASAPRLWGLFQRNDLWKVVALEERPQSGCRSGEVDGELVLAHAESGL